MKKSILQIQFRNNAIIADIAIIIQVQRDYQSSYLTIATRILINGYHCHDIMILGGWNWKWKGEVG